jgi:hypothetical protein
MIVMSSRQLFLTPDIMRGVVKALFVLLPRRDLFCDCSNVIDE